LTGAVGKGVVAEPAVGDDSVKYAWLWGMPETMGSDHCDATPDAVWNDVGEDAAGRSSARTRHLYVTPETRVSELLDRHVAEFLIAAMEDVTAVIGVTDVYGV